VGPITLFDKSFLQSLSLDEAVFFDHFFMCVICPVFYVETLADLEKVVRAGRTPEQEVGIIADKVPEMSGYPCAYHLDLAASNLFGWDLPLNGRIPAAGGKAVKLDGQAGFVHEESPESQAFRRWQEREFLVVERRFAQRWRTALNSLDLEQMAAGVRAAGITPTTCRSLEGAKMIVDRFLERDGAPAVDQLKLALLALEVPPQGDFQLFGAWARHGRLSLRRFAPYAAYVVSVELFFRIALAAGLIGAGDANNRTDTAYLFYAPFCQVFVSSDNLHRRLAPQFLRPDQDFVWGPDLKADLNRIADYYAQRSEEEKERGLMALAPRPPRDDHNGIIVRLWDRHLMGWRDRAQPQPRDPEEDAKILAHINRLDFAQEISPDEIDFDPSDPQFVKIERRVSRRRGHWWQLPRNLEG